MSAFKEQPKSPQVVPPLSDPTSSVRAQTLLTSQHLVSQPTDRGGGSLLWPAGRGCVPPVTRDAGLLHHMHVFLDACIPAFDHFQIGLSFQRERWRFFIHPGLETFLWTMRMSLPSLHLPLTSFVGQVLTDAAQCINIFKSIYLLGCAWF